ncbi:type III secretion protein HrpD [Enterobacteriaceae bacterium RIT693]|nr:type III secretion protein HrpD [Enterobacteriaceae bacterium RIT693]
MASLDKGWLSWWLEGFWQQADASWHGLPWFQLDEPRRLSLIRQSPQALSAMLGLAECLPDSPDARLLALISLFPHQRARLFVLVAEVCQPGSRAGQLEEPQRIWCERLTRGLRPGVWLPSTLSFRGESDFAVLYLLRPLFTPVAWQRLRFSFPQPDVELCEGAFPNDPTPPLNRLQALWEGALWQAQQYQTSAPNDSSWEQ